MIDILTLYNKYYHYANKPLKQTEKQGTYSNSNYTLLFCIHNKLELSKIYMPIDKRLL